MSLFRVVRGGTCILALGAVILLSPTAAEVGTTSGDREALVMTKEYLNTKAL